MTTPPPPPASDAEAKARLDAAQAELDALVPAARALVGTRVAEAKARVAHARERQATWDATLAQLEPHRAHPGAAVHLARASHMRAMYEAMAQMLGVELAALEATGQALAADGVPAWGAFKDANDDLRFHEQRRRMTTALGAFLWSMNAAGAQAVHEAAGPSPEGEAAAIAAAMAADLAVERLVVGLSSELADAEAAVAWAQGAWQGFEKLGPDARRAVLKDARWADLDGAIACLDKLHARLGGTPALTRLFPKPDRLELPYGPPADAKLPGRATRPPEAPAGHDQVSLNQGRATSFKLGEKPGLPKRP